MIYWFIPAVIIAVLLYMDLLHAERKSSAYILEHEIIINRTLAFGLFVYVFRKRLTDEESDALQHYLDILEAKDNQPLSISAINELVHAHIIFYRYEPVFS